MRHIYRFACIAAALLVLVTPGCATAPPPVQESDVTMVVDGFYQAIRKADGPAAMQFIAPDAEFIETGKLETRSEYDTNHLPADINFESQVQGKRGPMRVKIQGETAWVRTMTEYEGTFEASPVNFVSAQLAVLTRNDGVWRIRSIAWSSMRR
jgi:ketosteroid isomerase-like protein